MKLQKGFINIPGWYFWLIPIVVEVVRIMWWIIEHVIGIK